MCLNVVIFRDLLFPPVDSSILLLALGAVLSLVYGNDIKGIGEGSGSKI